MTEPTAPQWGVVIPVKRLATAKSRLARLGDTRREQLALSFAADVVAAASACSTVDVVVVVTDDERAAQTLAALGAVVVPDTPDAGLNAALTHGEKAVTARDTSLGVAALSADLPALTAAALGEALAGVPVGRRAHVADRSGTGTTLLAARGVPLDPAFGPGSSLRHATSGSEPLEVRPELRLDVDTPDDLAAASLLGLGVHTTRVLASP